MKNIQTHPEWQSKVKFTGQLQSLYHHIHATSNLNTLPTHKTHFPIILLMRMKNIQTRPEWQPKVKFTDQLQSLYHHIHATSDLKTLPILKTHFPVILLT